MTVVMSVYNAGEHLRPALQSILDQTYENLEVFVIDDGNPNGSMNGIRDIEDPRVHFMQQQHAGKATALNRALALARGEFYAIQDADDISHPHRIEIQVRHLMENPEVACAFCGFDLILDGEHVAPLAPAKSAAECQREIEQFIMPGHDPTAMFRMSLVRDFSYEESLAIGQGFDYVLRVGEKHPMITVGECLYSYRVEHQSHSRRDPIRREELVHAILTRACDRRNTPESEWPEVIRRPPGNPDRPPDPQNNIAAHFIESALHLRRQGQFRRALKTAWTCARVRPLDPHYLKALVMVLTPGPILKLLRRHATPTARKL